MVIGPAFEELFMGKYAGMLLRLFTQGSTGIAITSAITQYLTLANNQIQMSVDTSDGLSDQERKEIVGIFKTVPGHMNLMQLTIHSFGFALGSILGTPINGSLITDLAGTLEKPLRDLHSKISVTSYKGMVARHLEWGEKNDGRNAQYLFEDIDRLSAAYIQQREKLLLEILVLTEAGNVFAQFFGRRPDDPRNEIRKKEAFRRYAFDLVMRLRQKREALQTSLEDEIAFYMDQEIPNVVAQRLQDLDRSQEILAQGMTFRAMEISKKSLQRLSRVQKEQPFW
jgi:hypothetical protein